MDTNPSRDKRIGRVDMAIDTKARGFSECSGGPQGRNPVFLLTVSDCPAKAGPPECSGMQTITDRPIRGSIGYGGSTCEKGYSKFWNPSMSTAPTFWTGIVGAQKVSGAMSGTRCVGPSVTRAIMFNHRCWTLKDGRRRPESQQDGPGLVQLVLPRGVGAGSVTPNHGQVPALSIDG